jgi:hypothetical protein
VTYGLYDTRQTFGSPMVGATHSMNRVVRAEIQIAAGFATPTVAA